MPRTLVTGGSGSIGKWVVRELLRAGHRVTVLAHDSGTVPADIGKATHVVQADIRDRERIVAVLKSEKPDRVCHLAAQIKDSAAASSTEMVSVNVVGTLNLLQAALCAGIETFVMASSKSVYGPATGLHAAPHYEPVPEEASLRPAGLYGATKASAEFLVSALAESVGVRAIALRFASTFGPGARDLGYGVGGRISQLIEAGCTGRPFVLAETGERSDYIYYLDIARAVRLALEYGGSRSGPLNVGTGRGLTASEIIGTARRVFPDARLEVSANATADAPPRTGLVLAARKARDEFGFAAAFDMERAMIDYRDRLRAEST